MGVLNEKDEVKQLTHGLKTTTSGLHSVAMGLNTIAVQAIKTQNTVTTHAYEANTYLQKQAGEFNNKVVDLVNKIPVYGPASGRVASLAAAQRIVEHDMKPGVRTAMDTYRTTVLNDVAQYRTTLKDQKQKFAAIGITQPIPAILAEGSKEKLAALPKFTPGATPEETKKRWDSLNRADQERLIRDRPELGNVNGIPSAARDRMNRQRLDMDLAEAKRQCQQRGIDPQTAVNNRDQYKNDPDMVRAINALQTRDGLNYQARAISRRQWFLLDQYGQPIMGADGNPLLQPAMLLKYDPTAFGWRGAAVLSMGNPDYACNVAVNVGGTGSSVYEGFLLSSNNKNLMFESMKADPNVAIVTDMDYKSPDNIHDPAMIDSTEARVGAAHIRDDVNALWATHQGPMHMTVIGHSYGSTVVADACVEGMHTNDIVLIGSPGTDMAGNESGLHLDNGRMYVGANTGDVVTDTGLLPPNRYVGLGWDPAMIYADGVRFHAETPTDERIPFPDHSRYFNKGSESLFSMATIVSGHSRDLDQQGMLGQRRILPGFEYRLDPEYWHHGYYTHYHDPADARRDWGP